MDNKAPSVTIAPLAVIGIGNTLAGDDGAGIIAVERLIALLTETERTTILCKTIPGDLFAISDFLDRAYRFIFLDAISGSPPGEIRTLPGAAPRAMAGSLHQTDIGSVMASLRSIGFHNPFPRWEIRGITIATPRMLGQKLSPAIDRAVDRLVESLLREIRDQ